MRTVMQSPGIDPLRFGRRRPVAIAVAAPQSIGDDLKLFLWTFAAGFVAVSIYLA